MLNDTMAVTPINLVSEGSWFVTCYGTRGKKTEHYFTKQKAKLDNKIITFETRYMY